jgi:hypothetical protein
VKSHYYKKLLGNLEADFILEGSSLLNRREREIAAEALGAQRNHVVLFKIDFESWSNQHFKRRGEEKVFEWRREYEKMLEEYEWGGEAEVLEITDINKAEEDICNLMKTVHFNVRGFDSLKAEI